jgi:hypothetical protein
MRFCCVHKSTELVERGGSSRQCDDFANMLTSTLLGVKPPIRISTDGQPQPTFRRPALSSLPLLPGPRT